MLVNRKSCHKMCTYGESRGQLNFLTFLRHISLSDHKVMYYMYNALQRQSARVFMRVCMCACVCACVHACVHACKCVCSLVSPLCMLQLRNIVVFLIRGTIYNGSLST